MITDLLGGQVQVTFSTTCRHSIGHIKPASCVRWR